MTPVEHSRKILLLDIKMTPTDSQGLPSLPALQKNRIRNKYKMNKSSR